jgi:hypothetical protein
MLIQILSRAGYCAELLRSAERIQANTVIISALPPFVVLPARSLCRQLRKINPDVTIVLGIWNSGLEPEKITQRLGASCFDRIAITLVQAVTDLTADNDAEPERARLVEVPEKGGLSDPSRLSDKSL